MFGALKRGRFRSLASLILVVNVVGELQQKRTLAASRGFLAAARLSCYRYYSTRRMTGLLILPSHTARYVCDHNPPTLQTDGQTDRQTTAIQRCARECFAR